MKEEKLSKYIIDVDIFDQKNNLQKKIIFSTRSSEIRIIDYESWKQIEKRKFKNIPQETLEDLRKCNFLIDNKENELSTILEENKSSRDQGTHLHTLIQPTAACPFNCGYCGQVHSPKGLTKDNQFNILKYLSNKLSEKTYESMSIGWFGAEPLSGISIIDQLSPQIQKIAREHSLLYYSNIVTNGLLLSQDVAKRLIYDYAVNRMEVTLDGVEYYHDQRRYLKTGGGTFNTIYTNLINLLKVTPEHVEINIRCNVDGRNRDGISPLLEQLAKDGLNEKVQIYFAPIHSWGNEAHKLAANKNDFAQWEIDWFIRMHELGFKCNYIPKRKKKLCIAVDPSSSLIDPFGNIFNCTEVSLVPTYEENGENKYKLGHVSEDNLKYPERRNILGDFYEEENLQRYHCYRCNLLPVCGGMCPKEWLEGRVPCPTIKYNIQERLLLHFAIHEDK